MSSWMHIWDCWKSILWHSILLAFLGCPPPPLKPSEAASGVTLVGPVELLDEISQTTTNDISIWWSYWGRQHPFAGQMFLNSTKVFASGSNQTHLFGALSMYTCPRQMVFNQTSSRFVLSACHGQIGWYRPVDLNCTSPSEIWLLALDHSRFKKKRYIMN